MSENNGDIFTIPALSHEGGEEDVQAFIDVDKYRKSEECGRDLCGEYAPFCVGCDKMLSNPCAKACLGAAEKKEEASFNALSRRRIRIAYARKRK